MVRHAVARRLFVALGAAGFMVAMSAPAQGVVAIGGNVVDCTGDSEDDAALQTALDASTDGTVITIDGLCTGTFVMKTSATVTLQGDPATGAATDGFDGDTGDGRVGPLLRGFDIESSTIQHLVFLNGETTGESTTQNGAGLSLTGVSSPQLVDLQFEGNDATGAGGGLSINTPNAGGDTLLSGVTFHDNFAQGSGGGFLVNTTSDLRLENVVADDNASNVTEEGPGFSGGGGGSVQVTTGSADSGTLDVVDSTFTDNAAQGSGGGLSVVSFDAELTMSFTNNTFGGEEEGLTNTAGQGGGGLYLVAAGPTALSGNHFVDNQADAGSVAVYANGGGGAQLIAAAGEGGSAALMLSGNQFRNNETSGSGGGAILAVSDGATAHLEANLFSGNVIVEEEQPLDGHYGGGLFVEWVGEGSPDDFVVTQLGNEFSGNEVHEVPEAGGTGGGGEWIDDAPVHSRYDRFLDNVVTGNEANETEGGGIGMHSDGGFATSLLLENDVVVGNTLETVDGTGEGSGGGVYVGNGCGECDVLILELVNTTVTDNDVEAGMIGPGLGGGGIGSFDVLDMANSIVWGNDVVAGFEAVADNDGTDDIGGFAVVDADFTDACDGDDPFTGESMEGNICADPQLVDRFLQTASSPTVDAGGEEATVEIEALEEGLDSDIEGDPRELDGDEDGTVTVDMGADEFAPAAEETTETTEATETEEPHPGDGVTPPGSIGENDGYCLGAADGGVFAFGNCRFVGAAKAGPVRAAAVGAPSGATLAAPMVGLAMTPDDKGYWMAGADGGVFAFGSAPFKGSLGGVTLQKPIVGIAATPTGQGYWLVDSGGGIYAFGDAAAKGSTSAIRLNQPIVAMAATPTGQGYWLVAEDGGVFAFGDARFLGSTGSIRLNQPMIGIAAFPGGTGYWLVAKDGGVFAFGVAPFRGSFGATPLNKPIVAIKGSSTGGGYWLVASDGGVFSFGTAPFKGSTATLQLNQPIVDMTG